jgi:hypothetical protein
LSQGEPLVSFYRRSCVGLAGATALIESIWSQISACFNLFQGSGDHVSANSSHRVAVEALKRGGAASASGDKGRHRPCVRYPGFNARLRTARATQGDAPAFTVP